MDDMAYDADQALAKPPGIVRLSGILGRRSTPLRGYAGKRTRSWRPRVPESRGSATCCIRSKSSRFYVHPFREGNGRAQRAFWDRVARDAGWYLDWTGVTGEVNDHASRVGSERQDLGPLIAMFDQIVTKR